MNKYERIAIDAKIEELEKKKQFDVDVCENPSFEPIKPGEVDYLKTKLSSKIKNKYCEYLLSIFIKNKEKHHKGIIKEVIGAEKLDNLNGGAIITSNHFHPFDSYPIRRECEKRRKKLYTIIAEHNYAGAGGFYGKLFRNLKTLPLAQNPKVLMECMRAVKQILANGDYILIYPEQALWWNYRKPRPLKLGAFDIAVKNNVPVVVCFITMTDSKYKDDDTYPVQEYTLHILDVIYPDPNLTNKENALMLKNKNEELTKEIYEKFYNKKLTY